MRLRSLSFALLVGLSAGPLACGRGTLLPADQPAIDVPASSPADIRAGILQGLAASDFTVDTEARGEIVARHAEKGRSVIIRIGYTGQWYGIGYVFSTGLVMKRDSANAILIEDRYRSWLRSLQKNIDAAIRQPKKSEADRRREYEALPAPTNAPVATAQPTVTAPPTTVPTVAAVTGPLVTDKPLSEVNDADRHAARDLYTEGFALQQAGKAAEALEKFQRSYRVYGAPTTGLRIAECLALLGKLVEAAETFRAVQGMAVPPGSNAAFEQAKQQAAAELQQVEPRIPRLTVIVTPATVRSLTVTVDGQPMSQALVGVPRPINPGTHRIVANAPGYKIAEATVEVKEKGTPSVTLALTR